MTNLTEFTFLSSDGKTRLHAMQWLPVETPRAVLQISHGVAEHIGRYDGFARYLNEQGIAVVGHDHLGHGGSLPEGGTPVYFGDGTPWETVVADIQLLHEQLRREFPGVPLCLMGHSMGSFLARSYLIRYPGTLRAAIIMGTGWQPQAKLAGGRAVAEVVCAAQGAFGGRSQDPQMPPQAGHQSEYAGTEGQSPSDPAGGLSGHRHSGGLRGQVRRH